MFYSDSSISIVIEDKIKEAYYWAQGDEIQILEKVAENFNKSNKSRKDKLEYIKNINDIIIQMAWIQGW